MKLKFTGDVRSLEQGISILCKETGFEISDSGIPVTVEKRSGDIEVLFEDGKGTIRYSEKIHFFRALGLLLEAISQHNSFHIHEEPQFTMNGIMIDVSRNAVMKVESIKKAIRKMALMGLNMIMLYTEDTYTLDNYQYFGYMRGRYDSRELKECDDYADIFGIEMIPCIQTLAHLEQALKWSYAKKIRDTDDILLVGDDQTYEFIESMIKAASAPFRSKRIHIGMDEAHYLGLGRYLNINGYRRRFDIMNEHLEKVTEITRKLGLHPMIWSDMFFRLGSKTGAYYDPNAVIPKNVIEKVPADLSLVYWDYYHHDEAEYTQFIKLHKEFGRDPVFAGGIWTWGGNAINYDKTFLTTNAALSACKKQQIKEVFATMWGDNGAETNFFSGLLGLQLFAEHGYAKEPDMDKLMKRFEFCTGGNAQHFIDLERVNRIPENSDKFPGSTANPSKYLLWQDVLIGLFDKHVEGLDLAGYYAELKDSLKSHGLESNEWSFVFDMPGKLCSVLELKHDIGIKLKECYDKNDINGLKNFSENLLPELYSRVNSLRIAHREQWLAVYKPFGWEILDIRYGGVLARIETAIARLNDFIAGKIDKIEELEEERLLFNSPDEIKDIHLARCNVYRRIVSASPL